MNYLGHRKSVGNVNNSVWNLEHTNMIIFLLTAWVYKPRLIQCNSFPISSLKKKLNFIIQIQCRDQQVFTVLRLSAL